MVTTSKNIPVASRHAGKIEAPRNTVTAATKVLISKRDAASKKPSLQKSLPTTGLAASQGRLPVKAYEGVTKKQFKEMKKIFNEELSASAKADAPAAIPLKTPEKKQAQQPAPKPRAPLEVTKNANAPKPFGATVIGGVRQLGGTNASGAAIDGTVEYLSVAPTKPIKLTDDGKLAVTSKLVLYNTDSHTTNPTTHKQADTSFLSPEFTGAFSYKLRESKGLVGDTTISTPAIYQLYYDKFGNTPSNSVIGESRGTAGIGLAVKQEFNVMPGLTSTFAAASAYRHSWNNNTKATVDEFRSTASLETKYKPAALSDVPVLKNVTFGQKTAFEIRNNLKTGDITDPSVYVGGSMTYDFSKKFKATLDYTHGFGAPVPLDFGFSAGDPKASGDLVMFNLSYDL